MPPVLTSGPAGHWDDSRASCPVVLREPDAYRMWYYGREHGFPGVTPDLERAVIPMGRTGAAISNDGIVWRKLNGPGVRGSVLDPSHTPGRFDEFQVGGTEVIKVGGEYRMYFQGARPGGLQMGAEFRRGFPLNIGLAVSSDGLTFTKIDGPHPNGAVLTEGGPGDSDAWYAGFPRVLPLAGGGFRLYYSAAGPGYPPSIHAAESANGVRWEKRGRVFTPNPDPDAFDARSVGSRSIIPWQGGYLMAYEAVSNTGVFSIGLATSPDALRWERLPAQGPGGRIIALGAPGSWDAGAMGTPYFVPEPDGSLRLYYVGFSQGHASIGMIRCDGVDITRWERFPA